MSDYEVYISPQATKELKELPANIRHRVKEAIFQLAEEPRPTPSKALEDTQVESVEVRRLRLEKWRIIYMIDDSVKAIDVIAIRKRPPYDYGDLGELLSSLL